MGHTGNNSPGKKADSSKNDRPAHKPTRFERTLLPEVETLVTIKATPNSVCHLRHEQDAEHEFQLDADEQGIVRFHARPHKDAESIELTLDCSDESGAHVRHTVALSVDSSGATVGGSTAPGPAGELREPLAGDPMALSNQELLARGYPPRPDRAQNPARYARWLKRVSQPFTQVKPTKVAHPSVRFATKSAKAGHALKASSTSPIMESPTLPLPPPKAVDALKLASPTLPLPPPIVRSMFNNNSNIWSGAYLTKPASQYFWIEADWDVPGVASINNLPYSAVAEWIGLDNGGTDLFQAGTDSECWDVLFGTWTFTNYWMWIETLPFAPWSIPNVPVSPGDSVSVDIFVADATGNTQFQDGWNGGLTRADNSVWFMIYNYSKGTSFWGTLGTAAYSQSGLTSTGYTGTTAEFIIERPTHNGSVAPLAFFGIASMTSCYYGDAEYGDRAWGLPQNGSTPWFGDLTYLNMVNQANNNVLLAFPISLPDPNNPGDNKILWFWTGSQ